MYKYLQIACIFVSGEEGDEEERECLDSLSLINKVVYERCVKIRERKIFMKMSRVFVQ